MFTQKHLLTSLLLTLLFSFAANAQQRTCSAMDVLDRHIQEDPNTILEMERLENFTQKVIESNSTDMKVTGVITIPVVVHVIYSNNNENISEAQINSQLQVMNDDFRRTNSDANNTWSQAADTEIEFCLATVDPNGNATSGITRKSSSNTAWGTNDAMKYSSQGGVDAWPTTDYLNMWVCPIGGGILGYAQFPNTGSAATDGVVMGPQYFGTTGYVSAPFDGGRTTTHEVGHWLNLRHIWGDGNCNADDFVSDTPTSDAANYGCATGHTSCSSTDMVQNYMDYSNDACMNLYTQGQKDRMRALFASGGARESLLNSGGCGSGGGGGNPPPTTCTDNDVSIDITFDNYSEETSWQITNASGAVVASGGIYGAGQTSVSESACLVDGCYDFTISDVYGDGICCSYGSGSYSVTGGGSTLASGGSFTSSETTNFCFSAPPPASCGTPTGLGTTALTETDGTLTWNAVSGATSYNVEVLVGSTSYPFPATTNSLSLNGFTASTTYQFRVQAVCSVNSSWSGYHSFTTPGDGSGGGSGGCDTVDSESFESGWGIWNDGGSDSYRINSSTYSGNGTYSIRLRDNTNSSVMTTDNLNLSAYNEVTVDFHYYANSMENNEDYWLQVSTDGGSSYVTISTWARGTDFNNNVKYNESVTMTGTFSSTTKIRFRCDATANADQVYIDDVVITGCATARLAGDQLVKVEDAIAEEAPAANTRIVLENSTMNVYPNPARDVVRVDYQIADSQEANLMIYDLSGKLISSRVINSDENLQSISLDVSGFNSGMYYVNIVTTKERLTKKLMIVD